MRSMRNVLISLALAAVLTGRCAAEVYRVGPDERYATLSAVASRLASGDVVVVVGDIRDNVVLARSGTQTSPITVRGMMGTVRGKPARPRISAADPRKAIISCGGDWTVIENIEFDGRNAGGGDTPYGLVQQCANLTLRNCYFHSFVARAVDGAEDSGSVAMEFCEFESCGSTSHNGKTVDVYSWTPGSVMRVEHCYFHDSLGQCHILTHSTKNIIRYNWFENASQQMLNISDRLAVSTTDRPEGSYPMHSDIVGNVFVQGFSPGMHYCMLSTGGHGADEPGPEGDFNIAHNLFVMNAFGPANDPTVFDLVLGNVDHVNMYNNVFLQMGGPPGLAYLRDTTWDTPATAAFIKRRGSPDPVVAGSNNWIYERSTGIPATFERTLRGLNPKFVDLLNGDYRPRRDSPLAGAGLWPLPKGRIVDLVPEYEPQRGIPAGLKARPRRKVTPPSIGPFEAPQR